MNDSVAFKCDDIVDKDMQFMGFNEFYEKRFFLKNKYEKLSPQRKRIYKLYVYSTCFETEYARDLMWEYLNSADEIYTGLDEEWLLRKNRKRGKR